MSRDYDYDNAMDQVAEWEEEKRYEEYMEKHYQEHMESMRLLESEERFNSRYKSGYLRYIYYVIEDLFYSLLSYSIKRKIM